jgi:hypothetical protein
VENPVGYWWRRRRVKEVVSCQLSVSVKEERRFDRGAAGQPWNIARHSGKQCRIGFQPVSPAQFGAEHRYRAGNYFLRIDDFALS